MSLLLTIAIMLFKLMLDMIIEIRRGLNEIHNLQFSTYGDSSIQICGHNSIEKKIK